MGKRILRTIFYIISFIFLMKICCLILEEEDRYYYKIYQNGIEYTTDGYNITNNDCIEFFPTLRDTKLETMEEINPDALYPSDMKSAIIGFVERFGMEPIILLDKEKCIKILIKQGMTEEEAYEYFEFNTIGSWMGEGTPAFATLID